MSAVRIGSRLDCPEGRLCCIRPSRHQGNDLAKLNDDDGEGHGKRDAERDEGNLDVLEQSSIHFRLSSFGFILAFTGVQAIVVSIRMKTGGAPDCQVLDPRQVVQVKDCANVESPRKILIASGGKSVAPLVRSPA